MGETNDYILPFSDSRYLTRDEVAQLSLEELRLARNEIYARHGYIFKDPALKAYFEAKAWYIPAVTEVDGGEFNDYELSNLDLILEAEGELN